MAMTDWTIIRRSLLSHLFSTITTVITVAVAVALMLVLLSMRDAGARAFARGGGNMHMLVSRDTDPMGAVLNGIFYARPPRNFIMWDKYREIAGDPRIVGDPNDRGMTPGFAIPVQQGDSYKGFPTLATTEEFFTKFTPAPGEAWHLVEGRFFTGDYEVVVGSAVERATGLKLGDKIILTHGTADSRGLQPGEMAPHEHSEYKFTVVGILQPTGAAHDRALFLSMQSSWILHAHDRNELKEAREEAEAKARGEKVAEHDHEHEAPTTAADLIDSDRMLTGIYVRTVTPRGSNVSSVVPQVFDQLRKESGITVSQPKQEIDKLFGIVGNINQILVAMAAVVMVSSGIAIMLALYNSMEQRRRQIAVLRVLGCSRPRVFGLVVTESAVLGMLGAAAGVLIALLGAWLVAGVMRNRLGLVVDPSLSGQWLVAVLLAAVALAAAAGLIPAVMAYRTSVARNLRPLG